MDKYEDGTYHKGSFRGGFNIDLKLIICEYKIVILSILQKYVLHWYYTYILHLVMDGTEAMICQHLYWHGIRNSVQKEVTNCDTFQRKKLSNILYVN